MIDPATRIGAVHLTVSDLDRSVTFYQSRLGFRVHRATRETAALGADGPDLLVLEARGDAPRVRGTTGLYHFAILVPSRADLAASIRRLATTRTALQGAADHGVSEAIYLADPDGNGIEVYRDRPRLEWPFVGGRLTMGTEPLDLDTLLATGETSSADALPERTVIGHVHLHVSHLDTTRHFYVDLLGFDLMQRFGPSALFVSAGGYHHHVGLNTWAGVGAPAPPDGAIGLRYFVVELPTVDARQRVVDRLRSANFATEARNDDVLVRDPSANAILLAVA